MVSRRYQVLVRDLPITSMNLDRVASSCQGILCRTDEVVLCCGDFLPSHRLRDLER
jgi:hypothetical protein